MKKFLLTIIAAAASVAIGTPTNAATQSGPDHVEPGQCHARVSSPALLTGGVNVRFE